MILEKIVLIWLWIIIFGLVLGYKANNYKEYMRSKMNYDRDDES